MTATEIVAARKRMAELRERVRDEARALRSAQWPELSAADRGRVLLHIDHAERHGHAYSIEAALSVLAGECR